MVGGGLKDAFWTVPTTKKQLLSDAMKRTGEWIFSQEIPSDITVEAGGARFSMHKFPLVSKSGYIHKLVAGKYADISMIDLSDIPGGAEAFELAAKFCYGFNFEISTTNVAMLRCAAEYLEMTDDHADANLVAQTEAYINEAALRNLSSAVTVLHSCENLLPVAEDLKIVSRCIAAVASKACKDSHLGTSDMARSKESVSSMNSQIKPMIDWWAEELVVLHIGFYHRVLTAMKSRGLNQGSLGAALMFYAQKSLRRLAHPSLNDLERKKVCRVMDCKKLSPEACAHAAQNERLPVHIVVQVLYLEQQRLRNAISRTFMEGDVGQQSQEIHYREVVSAATSPCDEFWALHQENQDLKIEVERMKIRLSHLEKDQKGTKPGMGKPPLHRKTFLNSVSKKLGKLNPFIKLPDQATHEKHGGMIEGEKEINF